MSERKLVSPLLDGFLMGYPMSSHDGIECCPAKKENSDEKYIVKIISIPASQVQLDALLLTGAYQDPAEATNYFKEVAESVASEAEVLTRLSKLEGFLPYEGYQIVPMEDGKLGYEVYLLSSYRRSLLRHMQKKPITHLDAVNLGLDLCAALAICRRAGFLYVDLKPANIFLSREKQFRIGDLGLIPLDSLAYTSLPGKYRSAYSPAEVKNDMKVLNTTVDTYAVGMILYQIYNEGTLPAQPLEPTDPFPHPSNADYEISSIIMKAIDPNPANRWADPMEMGQALVGYMQRNTVNNTPITPPSGILNVSASSPAENISSENAEETAENDSNVMVSQDESVPETETTGSEDCAAESVSEECSSEPTETTEEAVSDVPEETNEPEDDEDLDFSIAFSEPAPEQPKAEPIAPVKKNPPVRRKRRSNNGILVALILLTLTALVGLIGFWFYQTWYLQTIHDLTLDGTQHELIVTVDTDMDTELLSVHCTDAYGNNLVQPIVNGQAVFTDLLPDSLYRIELEVSGFHKLTGKTAEIFTTDAIPTILSMSAITGSEAGSAIVSFTVDGTDPEEWVLTCSADGEEDIVQNFTGHTVTLTGLTVDKIYTMTLGTSSDDQILGENTLDFRATQLILAENLAIADCTNGTMTVRWDSPADTAVEKWYVRCYNDNGQEESLEISGTEIAFTGIDSSKAYTVEVTAEGMTQSSRISITANPLTITGLDVDAQDLNQLTVTWTHDGAAPEGGWLLMYTLDGISDQQNVVKCTDASAVVTPRIPSAKYTFTIQAMDSTSIFNNIHTFTSPAANVYENQGLSCHNVRAHLLKTPEEEGWTIDSIGEDAFTDTFQPGDSISVVLTTTDNFYLPEMDIQAMYVIRDGNGNVLSNYISNETIDWKSLWYDDDYHNGELTIPDVPEEPGDYSLSLYFDNLAVTAIKFTIAE